MGILADIKQKLGELRLKDMTAICLALKLLNENYEKVKDLPDPQSRKSDKQRIEIYGPSEHSVNSDRVFPLDAKTLLLAELAFREDLKNVRIHTGAEADELARRSGADAFASGQDIYFREGLYRPDSEEGKNLLIHELQHVIQYQKGLTPNFLEDREALEYEAYKKESMIAGFDLHGLENAPLKDESESHTGDSEEGSIDGSSSDIRDFGKKKKEYIRVIGRSGKVYLIERKERELVIQEAVQKVKEKIELQWDYLGSDDKRRVMERLNGQDFF